MYCNLIHRSTALIPFLMVHILEAVYMGALTDSSDVSDFFVSLGAKRSWVQARGYGFTATTMINGLVYGTFLQENHLKQQRKMTGYDDSRIWQENHGIWCEIFWYGRITVSYHNASQRPKGLRFVDLGAANGVIPHWDSHGKTWNFWHRDANWFVG